MELLFKLMIELGSIRWGGADGSNIGFAARIVGAVDGTPGANDMPGRISSIPLQMVVKVLQNVCV